MSLRWPRWILKNTLNSRIILTAKERSKTGEELSRGYSNILPVPIWITTKLQRYHPDNQFNTSWREALYPRTERRNHFTTMRLRGCVEWVWEGWLGSNGNSWSARGIFQCLGTSPWEGRGLNLRMGSPAFSTRARKESRDAIQLWKVAWFLSARERWLEIQRAS